MSFEGFYEYLCEEGHYFTRDAYDLDTNNTCSYCDKKAKWMHLVDQTNGIEYEEYDNLGNGVGEPLPYSIPAPIIVIGFIDKWQEDHYGNKYATKILQYRPASDAWKEIK